MRFLTNILWLIVLVALAVFAINNWVPVTLVIWNNVLLDTWLPVPLLAALLAGMIPYFIAHKATRWSLNRKLTNAERALAQSQPSPDLPEQGA